MPQICLNCQLGASIVSAYSNLKKRRKANPGDSALTCSALVLSRRVERRNDPLSRNTLWDYLITFRLEDGREVTLHTSEEMYAALKEGSSGRLVRQGDTVLDFVLA